MVDSSLLAPRSSPVTTRFAPSPTGHLHLGNLRTALLNWLFARRAGGRFLLRFEDTDPARAREAYVESIREDLRWLGLDWDGEEEVTQSSRRARHEAALERLADGGAAYRCFCTDAQLALDRRLARGRGEPPRYTGRCRRLPPREAAARAGREPHVWRLAARAAGGEIEVHDRLRGTVRFARADLDDPVLTRSDNSFTFLLPNAVDDADDGVTHVLRGDDHLTNSAYQVWLLGALKLAPPVYLHHGLLLSEEGAKLSKRAGGHAIRELREAGVLPEALVQTVARLGHPNLPGESASAAALAEHFEPERLSTAAVRWSDAELWRRHGRLLRRLPAERLAAMLAGLFPGAPESRRVDFARLVGSNLERLEDARAFSRLLDADAPPGEEARSALREAGGDLLVAARAAWEEIGEADWRAWTARVGERTGRRGRALFMPLRAALTGAVKGPEMSAVVAFLGGEGVRERLNGAMEFVDES